MDTYWNIDSEKCARCGICVTTCKKEGYSILSGGRNRYPSNWSDNPPCHHCGACINTCPYEAIIIERW